MTHLSKIISIELSCIYIYIYIYDFFDDNLFCYIWKTMYGIAFLTQWPRAKGNIDVVCVFITAISCLFRGLIHLCETFIVCLLVLNSKFEISNKL